MTFAVVEEVVKGLVNPEPLSAYDAIRIKCPTASKPVPCSTYRAGGWVLREVPKGKVQVAAEEPRR